ncbi:Glutathione S-transferase [Echinococcus granulosus]|uniref:glutathione transferase n=1 Tax=Echinococcus granulosus TaxID=6210 RepID=W6UBG9_ECHGR|nr:Glutathione S-transferase [Echinococcus granulosus]EUB57911.1 Glutathione S-transferase [Echinococcus granulosus]
MGAFRTEAQRMHENTRQLYRLMKWDHISVPSRALCGWNAILMSGVMLLPYLRRHCTNSVLSKSHWSYFGLALCSFCLSTTKVAKGTARDLATAAPTKAAGNQLNKTRDMCAAMAPVLAYWDIKGLGERSRLLLKYVGVEYDDKQYTFGPAPTLDRNAWLSEKFSLGLDFPNLPYYIDGDFKLTQSGAILEYIADRHGMSELFLIVKSDVQYCICFNARFFDLQMSFGDVCYSADWEKLKPGFMETLAQKLTNFEAFLDEKVWLTGEKISYPDFSLCEVLIELKKFEPTCLQKYPKLQAYLTRFENLPQLKDYIASKEFAARACTGADAHWRGDS